MGHCIFPRQESVTLVSFYVRWTLRVHCTIAMQTHHIDDVFICAWHSLAASLNHCGPCISHLFFPELWDTQKLWCWEFPRTVENSETGLSASELLPSNWLLAVPAPTSRWNWETTWRKLACRVSPVSVSAVPCPAGSAAGKDSSKPLRPLWGSPQCTSSCLSVLSSGYFLLLSKSPFLTSPSLSLPPCLLPCV